MTLTGKSKREHQRLAEIATEYAQQGYSVKIAPSDENLPDFLTGLHPDLIATRDGETLVVEVRSRREIAQASDLVAIESALTGRNGWRFELIIDGAEPETQPILDLDQINGTIREASHLKQEGHLVAAFLLLWAVTEGLLRYVAAREQIDLDSTATGYLIRNLYSVGLLARYQYLALEDAVRLRDFAVHGFQVSISDDAVSQLAEISHQLLSEVEVQAA